MVKPQCELVFKELSREKALMQAAEETLGFWASEMEPSTTGVNMYAVARPSKKKDKWDILFCKCVRGLK